MAAASAEQIKDANLRYHDGAADDYDYKWNIRYDRDASAIVVDKLRKALGRPPARYGSALEIGAGTGYFTLNLLAEGIIEDAVATDISAGMLDRLGRSARELGVRVRTVRCEADRLPFADDSFDLVFGHAVLHHLPDLRGAFAEFRRVLRPGGTLAFCGEPSRHGDRLADVPKKVALAAAPLWRSAMGARPAAGGHAHGDPLEWQVDVHSFTPADLTRLMESAGFEEPRVAGEELTASWFGWANRTLESTAEPETVPVLWRWYAYGGYRLLRVLDRAVLEPRLPPAIFYNLTVSARAPA